MNLEIMSLRVCPEKAGDAAEWFHEKWGIPREEYEKSIRESLAGQGAVPQWFIALNGLRIVGGCGVIENDFHPRKDLTPNVCAVFVEEEYRRRGIAGRILRHAAEEMRKQGIGTLYLLTDLQGFYERYGWEYCCDVCGDGEETPSRMLSLRTADVPDT